MSHGLTVKRTILSDRNAATAQHISLISSKRRCRMTIGEWCTPNNGSSLT
jgi:hypothetical protein